MQSLHIINTDIILTNVNTGTEIFGGRLSKFREEILAAGCSSGIEEIDQRLGHLL